MRRDSMPPGRSRKRACMEPTRCPPHVCSNSLLECLVFGEAAARHIAANTVDSPEVPEIRAWDESRVTDSDEEVVITQTWGEIRRFMWNYVGIVRTTKRLER